MRPTDDDVNAILDDPAPTGLPTARADRRAGDVDIPGLNGWLYRVRGPVLVSVYALVLIVLFVAAAALARSGWPR